MTRTSFALGPETLVSGGGLGAETARSTAPGRATCRQSCSGGRSRRGAREPAGGQRAESLDSCPVA